MPSIKRHWFEYLTFIMGVFLITGDILFNLNIGMFKDPLISNAVGMGLCAYSYIIYQNKELEDKINALHQCLPKVIEKF